MRDNGGQIWKKKNSVPTDEAVKEAENRLLGVETNITNWQRRQNANNNFSATVPYDMEQQKKEMKEFLDDLTTRDQRMMFAVITMVITADSKEQLENDTEALLTTARKHLCQFATLRFQQVDGLNTVMPFGTRKIDAFRTLTTESLSVFIPFRVQDIFHENGIYYGQNVISKNMIIADRKQLLNGNSFILGVSGGGKSFAAKGEIINQVLSSDADIIIIDPEREYSQLVNAMGGEVINISATSDNHINAMDMNKDYGDGANPVILKSEFIMSLCEQLIGGTNLGAKQKSIIDRCTASVYRSYQQNDYQGHIPTLQDFRAELLQQDEPEAKELALAIELFTHGSLNTFAKQTNVDTNNRLICYDILDLGKQLMPIGMLVVLDSILNRITQNRAKGKNTFIFIDEIYLLFQHEYSANFLFTLWKRVRKYGAYASGITQNVDDLLQSHTARTMLANSEFIIMLNQASTDRLELAKLLNISDLQMSYITNVEAGHGLANVIGTDLSKYKLITKGKFACNPMHVGRDERLPVALYDEEEPAIVSPAYFMFEVVDNSILNEDYLMMWFRRPEFDRICWLHTDGSVRGGITWDDICRLELPIPPIEKQFEIVNSYKAITERIALKQKINDNLAA